MPRERTLSRVEARARSSASARPAWLIPLLIGTSVLLFAVIVGFVGAPARQTFDWRLSAEVGTALGTVMLASYTAWLARTTREEVGLAVDDLRIRNRPVVVAVAQDVGVAPLDPTVGETTPVLEVFLANVGLGPAFDLHLSARYGENRWEAEGRIALLGAGSTMDYQLSLSNIPNPTHGFLVERFAISGDVTDRGQAERHPITVLKEKGLRDEQRAAVRIAAVRASLWFAPGGPPERLEPPARNVRYPATVGNNGPGKAEEVQITLLRAADGAQFGDVIRVPDIEGRRPAPPFVIEVPADHPALSVQLTWKDGTGPQQQEFESAYPELPPVPPEYN